VVEGQRRVLPDARLFAEEMTSKTFRELTHPDDVIEYDEFIAAVAAGTTSSLERDRRYLHRDGSIVWVHVRAEVIRDPAGVPLYAVSHLQDITDHKRSEQQLRDSERRLRSLIDHTPSLVYVKGRDYRYQLVNSEFERVFGVRGDWIIGRRDEDILPASAIGRYEPRTGRSLTMVRSCRKKRRSSVTVGSVCC